MTQSIEVFAIFCSILVVIFVVTYFRSPLGPERAERKRRSDRARRSRPDSAEAPGAVVEDGTDESGTTSVDDRGGEPAPVPSDHNDPDRSSVSVPST